MDILYCVYLFTSWWTFGLLSFFFFFCLLHTFGEFSCGHVFSILLGIYLGVELQNHVRALKFNSLRDCQVGFQIGCTILIFTSNEEGSHSCTLYQHVSFFLIIAILVGEVISHYRFGLLGIFFSLWFRFTVLFFFSFLQVCMSRIYIGF
jgi:hypothetical protein